MTTGRIFNVQRFAVHDGPGIRTTVFLQGCPLRCSWCHNPEGIECEHVVAGVPSLCIGCAACVEVCEQGVARPLDQEPASLANRSECIRCGSCATACPSGARISFGEICSVDELMVELEKDSVFYAESGGGITFSGGEPLAVTNQSFLRDCLRACGELGFHRTVDTSGYCTTDALLATAQRCELFLFDLKLMDTVAHRRYTGVDNAGILQNLRALSEAGYDVWIRIPVVPGVNDGRANIEALSAYLASLPRAHPVHLLPYHAMAPDKYPRLGLEFAFTPPTKTEDAGVGALADYLGECGLDVRIGG